MYEQIANNEIEGIMEKTRKMLGIAPEEYEVVKMKDTLGKCVNGKITINPELMQFLRKNTNLIISTFNKTGTRNLRILKHALNDFQKIFETVNKFYPNTNLRVLQTMLIFTIAVSFEIKAGKITKDLIENSNKSCKVIVAPNTEFIMMAQKDEEFYNILRGADLATPDSVGVMIGGKLQKKPFKQRIPGQMYFRKVLEVGEKEGWTFYLLGGKDDVPALATENIKKLYPNIKIVGYHEGFFKEESEESVIEEINKLKPNVLFVAMGAPLQEKWIQKHKDELQVDVAAGQGGTFDYEAGKIKRAPVIFQKLGIEWFWRLMLQPSRFFRMLVLPIYLMKITFTKDITKGKFDK